MKYLIEKTAIVLSALTILFILIYDYYRSDLILTLSITAGTTAYHFDMRIIVGYIIDATMHNKANYNRKWYQPLKFESKLYEILRVKEWKDKIPTYIPDSFSLTKHSREEVIRTMCQAEIVHEVIALLSLLPIGLIPIFHADLVFIITSLLACIIDMMFVVMQRYNRPRLIKLIEKRKSR